MRQNFHSCKSKRNENLADLSLVGFGDGVIWLEYWSSHIQKIFCFQKYSRFLPKKS